LRLSLELHAWQSVVYSGSALVNEVNLRRVPVSTGMGDRVRVKFPVLDTYLGM